MCVAFNRHRPKFARALGASYRPRALDVATDDLNGREAGRAVAAGRARAGPQQDWDDLLTKTHRGSRNGSLTVTRGVEGWTGTKSTSQCGTPTRRGAAASAGGSHRRCPRMTPGRCGRHTSSSALSPRRRRTEAGRPSTAPSQQRAREAKPDCLHLASRVDATVRERVFGVRRV